jgi:hypothetical protein
MATKGVTGGGGPPQPKETGDVRRSGQSDSVDETGKTTEPSKTKGAEKSGCSSSAHADRERDEYSGGGQSSVPEGGEAPEGTIKPMDVAMDRAKSRSRGDGYRRRGRRPDGSPGGRRRHVTDEEAKAVTRALVAPILGRYEELYSKVEAMAKENDRLRKALAESGGSATEAAAGGSARGNFSSLRNATEDKKTREYWENYIFNWDRFGGRSDNPIADRGARDREDARAHAKEELSEDHLEALEQIQEQMRIENEQLQARLAQERAEEARQIEEEEFERQLAEERAARRS